MKNKTKNIQRSETTMEDKLSAFGRLLDIMEKLRAQCPWDKKQTFDSLRTLTIEETYELSDAIMGKNYDEIKKELGDVLLHIVFYAKLGDEANSFDIKDVIDNLCDKLIYRHPHIFSDVKVADDKEVEQNWEQLKLKEKNGNKTVLSGIPKSLPAVIKAYRIQDKVRGVGFDWEQREQVWDKVKEEIDELEEAAKEKDEAQTEKEFGDLFFSLINAARLYGINPETALELTNQKFVKRFNYLESKTITNGKSLKDMSLSEMDKIWEKAKQFD